MTGGRDIGKGINARRGNATTGRNVLRTTSGWLRAGQCQRVGLSDGGEERRLSLGTRPPGRVGLVPIWANRAIQRPAGDRQPHGVPLHRKLPHLRAFVRQPLVFITVCTDKRQPVLACAEAHQCLHELWTSAPQYSGWHVGRYVLMPDHLHLFARPALDAVRLAHWVRTWKSLSTRRLAPLIAPPPHRHIWQTGYYDRYVRSSESYGAAWTYVADNPTRAKLCLTAAEWPFQGEVSRLEV